MAISKFFVFRNNMERRGVLSKKNWKTRTNHIVMHTIYIDGL